MNRTLTFATSTELLRIPVDSLVYIKADGNYSAIFVTDGNEYVITLQLGQIEQRMSSVAEPGDNRFVRIGKSLIVNLDFVIQVNPSRQRLTLSDCRSFRYDVSASREALRSLKDYLEKGGANEKNTAS